MSVSLTIHESVEVALQEAQERLSGWFHAAGSVLVGFSGGVDSAFLAVAALDALGTDSVLAVIGRSRSYPLVQWERARAFAAQFGIPLHEVDTDELNDPRYAANPTNRCYFCKSELWHVLTPIARERGLAVVVDGTNADDVGGHRPGMQAANENGVRSPLAECGLTKAQIRQLSQLRGLPTWNQPASPCLSSRIPYGTEVTPERLVLVERAEAALRALGICGDMRVRLYREFARVELGNDELETWLSPDRRALLGKATAESGFERSALDLEGFRSGSMNRDAGALANNATKQLDDILKAKGIDASVQEYGSMAVIADRDRAVTSWRGTNRTEVIAAARSLGFAYASIELTR